MATNAVLDPILDRKPLGRPLDGARPEFSPFMDHLSAAGRGSHPLGVAPTALIVNRRGVEGEPLREALEEDGWYVQSCPGPADTGCAILRGEPCRLRESVDVAVVYVDPKAMWPGSERLPRLRCARDSASPGVIALEGSFEPPRFGRGEATVGALRDPKVVIEVIDELCTASRS